MNRFHRTRRRVVPNEHPDRARLSRFPSNADSLRARRDFAVIVHYEVNETVHWCIQRGRGRLPLFLGKAEWKATGSVRSTDVRRRISRRFKWSDYRAIAADQVASDSPNQFLRWWTFSASANRRLSTDLIIWNNGFARGSLGYFLRFNILISRSSGSWNILVRIHLRLKRIAWINMRMCLLCREHNGHRVPARTSFYYHNAKIKCCVIHVIKQRTYQLLRRV